MSGSSGGAPRVVPEIGWVGDCPPHAEEVFLSSGPPAFEFLLEMCGSRASSLETSGIGAATLSRWINAEPGDLFGPRKDVRTWRSVWFGYPSPLPGFDRVVEVVRGRGHSWLSVACSSSPLGHVLASARAGGLSIGDAVGPDEVSSACRRLGIPTTTRWRWQQPVPWPYQWEVLDRLSLRVAQVGWPELVLSYRGGTSSPRKVPITGLARLVSDVIPGLRSARGRW